MTLLKKYVDAGGSLVVMEDPIPVTEFGDSPDPLADYLTSDWGITLNNDIVIDLVNTQNPFQAVSSQYRATPNHPEPDPKLYCDPPTGTKYEHP